MSEEEKVVEKWITKYAMTSGIHRRSGIITDVGALYDTKTSEYFTAREIFNTFAEAKSHAELMRKKKLLSLKKQIKRIEAIVFTEEE